MMNIVVCVKQVPDTVKPLRVDNDGRHIDTGDLTFTINPCDLAAVKWATNRKEKSKSGEVTVLSAGLPSAEKSLRECFAYGADRAFLLNDRCFEDSDAYATGVLLSRAISQLNYDIVLCGFRAVDTNDGWVGPVIASKLGIPCISRVIDIRVSDEAKELTVERRLDGINREFVKVTLPCLLTVDPLLDKPRYPSVGAIRAAQKREIEHYDRTGLALSLDEVGAAGSKTQTVQLSVSKPRPKRLFTPDSNLPAAERIRLIMSGGMTEKADNRLEGKPEEIVPELVYFLRQKKIIR
jgi:electron transfer flavoprotein beta subunit